MRRFALVALLALFVAASASAAKPKVVRVVKHHGALTASVTYALPLHAPESITLEVRRHGRLLLRRRVASQGPVAPQLSFRFVAGNRAPAVVVDTYLSTSIALLAPRPAWIDHFWGRYGYRGVRRAGHYYFDSSDNRFVCASRAARTCRSRPRSGRSATSAWWM